MNGVALQMSDKHFYPTIELHDTDGSVYRVEEVVNSTTKEGFKKVVYKLEGNKEISLIIR